MAETAFAFKSLGHGRMIQHLNSLLPAAEFSDFERSLKRYPDRCIRMRTDRRDESLPFETEPVPWYPDGRWLLDPSFRPGGWLGYAAADYYIQDAASLLPLSLLEVEHDDAVCDLCAAPGGKATAIAERLGPRGVLVANEAIRSRLDPLRHSLARTGRANWLTACGDPEALYRRSGDRFDRVLVDVPCSGQSLLSKGKQGDAAFSSKQVEHCALRARRILEVAMRLLKPGGRLVFSTCTFSPEENEAQVAWMMETYPDAWEPVTIEALKVWASPLHPGAYRVWPHRDRCAGGFCAALDLKQPLPEGRRFRSHPQEGGRSYPPRGASRRGPWRTNRGDRALETQLREFLGGLGESKGVTRLQGSNLTVLEPGVAAWLDRSPEGLAPSTAVRWEHQHAEPTHALAMLQSPWFTPRNRIEWSDAEAAAYVAGESLPARQFSAEGIPWAVAQWSGKPLGWMKGAGNRWNNHLPAWARLRMESSIIAEPRA